MAINTIETGGMTNLFDGWRLGRQEVEKFKNNKSLNRILILSDGNANVGNLDIDDISRACSLAADDGVSTSTYGLGNNFNELLMLKMADSGRGKGYYGDTS